MESKGFWISTRQWWKFLSCCRHRSQDICKGDLSDRKKSITAFAAKFTSSDRRVLALHLKTVKSSSMNHQAGFESLKIQVTRWNRYLLRRSESSFQNAKPEQNAKPACSECREKYLQLGKLSSTIWMKRTQLRIVIHIERGMKQEMKNFIKRFLIDVNY